MCPINIRIEPDGDASYHSIGAVEWREIPPFAVLTGVNGAGKTQLLDLLAQTLKKLPDSSKPPISRLKVTIEGEDFDPGEVAHIPHTWRVHSGGQAGLDSVTEQQGRLQKIIASPERPEEHAARRRIERVLGGSLSDYTIEEALEALPENYSHLLDYTNVTQGLAQIFYEYKFRRFDLYENGITGEALERQAGPPPWEILNDTFRAAAFPYEVTPPPQGNIRAGYKLELHDRKRGVQIDPSRLSSGEQIILGVVMWLYNAQSYSQFPKLLLMDEPDAHLHPSMAHHFISVLKDVLVDHYGVRVILTTHSASTVALTPEESIFVMSRDAPRISKPPSKAHCVGLLTAGLVAVGEGTRYVLVEDKDDVDFHSTVKGLLSEYGPREDTYSLAPAPSIVFLPVSTKKTSGGCSVVRQWVEKFSSDPLDQMILGIVDQDGQVKESSRIFVSDRYSIENYLFDPINVYGLLLDSATASSLPDIGVTAGNEHLIGDAGQTDLQSIVDYFKQIIEANPTFSHDSGQASRPVEFTNGIVLKYPEWMISHRGHDIETLYQSKFGGAKLLSRPRLLSTMRRIRFLPKDLADMLKRVQDFRPK